METVRRLEAQTRSITSKPTRAVKSFWFYVDMNSAEQNNES